jgi:hypothetical protein
VLAEAPAEGERVVQQGQALVQHQGPLQGRECRRTSLPAVRCP